MTASPYREAADVPPEPPRPAGRLVRLDRPHRCSTPSWWWCLFSRVRVGDRWECACGHTWVWTRECSFQCWKSKFAEHPCVLIRHWALLRTDVAAPAYIGITSEDVRDARDAVLRIRSEGGTR